MRTLLVTIALVMLLIAPLAAWSSVVQNPDDKNWRHLVTSDNGNDIFYIPKISYGNIREIWWFERDRDPNKEISVNFENYNCELGASRLLQIKTDLKNELVRSGSYDDSE